MTIWTSEHKSDAGRDYKLSIIDSEGGTLVGEMIVNQQGFTLSDTGKGRTLHSRIIGKSLKFVVQVQDSDQEDFIESLATSEEGRYLVELERGTDVIFRGGITTDSVEIENFPKPYDFQLEAVDGLTLLKDVPGNVSSITNPNFKKSLHEILLAQLELSSGYSLYSISDTLLTVSMDWWSEEHETEGQNLDGNALVKTYVSTQTYSKERDGERVALSAYAIIEDICKIFNARIYYDEGAYHYEQFAVRESSGTVARQYYSINGTELTDESDNFDIDIDQTDNFHMAGGRLSILEPLKSFTVQYQQDPQQSFLPPSPPFAQEDPIVWREVGEIENSVEDVLLEIIFDIENTLTGPNDDPSRNIVFLFYLKVGDYYLDGNPQNMEWTTDSSNVFIFGAGIPGFVFPIVGGQISANVSTEAITPPLVDSGTVEVAFRAGYRYWDGTQWVYEYTPPGTSTHSYTFVTQKLSVISEEGATVPIQFTSSQDTGRASDGLSILAGDGLSSNRPNVLTIKLAALDFQVTSGWRAGGTGDYQNIAALISSDVLSQRLRPLKLLYGTIFAKTNNISITNRIGYDNRKFIFNSSKLTSNFDEVEVEAIEIKSDNTGVSTESEIEGPESEEPIGFDPNDPTGGGGSDPNDPPNQGIEGLITSEVIYSGVAITEVPILEADDDYFITGDRIVIRDAVTGYEHALTVDGPLEEGDTEIIVEAFTPDRNISIYSPVQYAPGQLVNLRPKYQLFENASGSEITITEFDLPDENNNTNTEMSRRLRVWRQSQKLVYTVGFTVDSANNKILFTWDLQDEYVEVELL